MGAPSPLSPEDRRHLRRCVDLAAEALEAATSPSARCSWTRAASRAWVGLGRIVCASSTEQVVQWQRELGVAAGPVAPLRITEVAPGVPVSGPDGELSAEVRALHTRAAGA